MQQRQGLARQEAVVDEEGLFDRQARIAPLQLAGAIVLHALREDQILGAGGRPHRVGLDKAQASDGAPQAGGLEKAARDRVAAKLLETGVFETAHARAGVRSRHCINNPSSARELRSTRTTDNRPAPRASPSSRAAVQASLRIWRRSG